MVRAGPPLEPEERRALERYVADLIRHGKAARTPEAIALSPAERWKPIDPETTTVRLPTRVSYALGSVALPFARTGNQRYLMDFAEILSPESQYTKEDLSLALICVAYWMDPSLRTEFIRSDTLATLEGLTAFINAYVQSLSMRALRDAPSDELNRHFAAFQRRRNGPQAKARSPRGLLKRMNPQVQDVISTYANLLQGKASASGVGSLDHYVVLCACALGRAFDQTCVAQLHVALATSVIWRTLKEFPSASTHTHPVLGERPSDPALWDLAAVDAARAIRRLADLPPGASSPKLVQTPARNAIGNVMLSAEALEGLQHLNEYVIGFARWSVSNEANGVAAPAKLSTFDARYRNTTHPIADGTVLLSTLPPDLIAAFHDLATQAHEDSNLVEQFANQAAVALGDNDISSWCFLLFECAFSWQSHELSPIEIGERDEYIAQVIAFFDGAVEPEAQNETQQIVHRSIPDAAPIAIDEPTIDLRDHVIGQAASPPRSTPDTTVAVSALDLTAESLLSDDELMPFTLANPQHAQELVEFGFAIADLVRLSQSLGENGQTASGWWSRFHRDAIDDGLPTPATFLERLSPRATRLADIYTEFLRAEDSRTATRAAQALAIPLNALHDDMTIRALTTGLAVSAIWTHMDEFSSDLFSDALLGAAPFTEEAIHICHRAQRQLEWGLQGLLHVESIAGV